MIDCSGCFDWFHRSCDKVPRTVTDIENNTWVRGNQTRFISRVQHDISRVSTANE